MSTALATTNGTNGEYSIIERVAIMGDLNGLQAFERVDYYTALCKSLNLNPYTKPFEYIELDKRLVLYATRGATDQLRDAKKVSVRVIKRETDHTLGIHIVEVEASTPDGRVDFASGIVTITKEGGEWKTAQSGKRFFAGNGQFEPMRGVDLANALMKAETKAKRRATLSICGLGWMDESEVGDVPSAKRVVVDSDTGEVLNEERQRLVDELRGLAQTARGLGLEPELGAPKDMTNKDLAKAIETVKAMIESEASQAEPEGPYDQDAATNPEWYKAK